jgi:hypothetical protein
MMESGMNKFEQKALNCESSGAVAAIIYNNETGTIGGGLATPTKVTIPVLDIQAHTAQRLQQLGTGNLVHVETKAGYGYASGTSMATPYVAGVAAKLWRDCPDCTNRDIEGCLLKTSVDLGPTGKDEKYGHGLVQADATFLCLRDTVQCCGVSETPVSSTADEVFESMELSSPAPILPVPSQAPVNKFPFIKIGPSSAASNSTKPVDNVGSR